MRKYLSIAFILLATSASAQELSSSQRTQLRSVCGADIQRLCPGIAPGGAQMTQCVQAKKAQLSKPCAEAITAMLSKSKTQ